MKNDQLINVESFETDREGVLINELYDKENNQYLYRIINVAEVRCKEEVGMEQNTAVQFDKKFKYADVFKNGKWSKVNLKDGLLNVSLLAGDSVYVLIY